MPPKAKTNAPLLLATIAVRTVVLICIGRARLRGGSEEGRTGVTHTVRSFRMHSGKV